MKLIGFLKSPNKTITLTNINRKYVILLWNGVSSVNVSPVNRILKYMRIAKTMNSFLNRNILSYFQQSIYISSFLNTNITFIYRKWKKYFAVIEIMEYLIEALVIVSSSTSNNRILIIKIYLIQTFTRNDSKHNF